MASLADTDPLAAVEAALVERLRAVFGTRVREVAGIGAALSEAEFDRVLRLAPAIYVAFLGGPREADRPGMTIISNWGVYPVAANAAGQAAQRYGDARQIGAYRMAALAASALDRHVLAGLGTLALARLEPLMTDGLIREGRTVYALTFELPLVLPVLDPATALDDFATFAPDWDVPPFGGEPDARDHYALGRAR